MNSFHAAANAVLVDSPTGNQGALKTMTQHDSATTQGASTTVVPHRIPSSAQWAAPQGPTLAGKGGNAPEPTAAGQGSREATRSSLKQSVGESGGRGGGGGGGCLVRDSRLQGVAERPRVTFSEGVVKRPRVTFSEDVVDLIPATPLSAEHSASASEETAPQAKAVRKKTVSFQDEVQNASRPIPGAHAASTAECRDWRQVPA